MGPSCRVIPSSACRSSLPLYLVRIACHLRPADHPHLLPAFIPYFDFFPLPADICPSLSYSVRYSSRHLYPFAQVLCFQQNLKNALVRVLPEARRPLKSSRVAKEKASQASAGLSFRPAGGSLPIAPCPFSGRLVEVQLSSFRTTYGVVAYTDGLPGTQEQATIVL